jgi:hypothetical protein
MASAPAHPSRWTLVCVGCAGCNPSPCIVGYLKVARAAKGVVSRLSPIRSRRNPGSPAWGRPPRSAPLRLSRDHGIRFPNAAAFVAGSFQAFVGNFSPELLQLPRCRLVRMPFGVVRSPRHLTRLRQMAATSDDTSCADTVASSTSSHQTSWPARSMDPDRKVVHFGWIPLMNTAFACQAVMDTPYSLIQAPRDRALSRPGRSPITLVFPIGRVRIFSIAALFNRGPAG